MSDETYDEVVHGGDYYGGFEDYSDAAKRIAGESL